MTRINFANILRYTKSHARHYSYNQQEATYSNAKSAKVIANRVDFKGVAVTLTLF